MFEGQRDINNYFVRENYFRPPPPPPWRLNGGPLRVKNFPRQAACIVRLTVNKDFNKYLNHQFHQKYATEAAAQLQSVEDQTR